MRAERHLIAPLDILSMRGRGRVGNGEEDEGWWEEPEELVDGRQI